MSVSIAWSDSELREENKTEFCCEITEDYLIGVGEPSGLAVCQTASISVQINSSGVPRCVRHTSEVMTLPQKCYFSSCFNDFAYERIEDTAIITRSPASIEESP